MTNCVILDTKCGMTPGELTPEGFIPGNIVCSVKFQMGTEILFLNEVEVEGEPNFYLTKVDEFEAMIKEDFEDQRYMDMMEASYLETIDNIDLTDYEYMYEDLQKNTSLLGRIVQYIVSIVRMDFEEMEMYIQATKNKDIMDITIPRTDIEEDLFGK
ncbi:MAG: hypothetical protein KBT48_12085 [Firmicutes bacterium]|nr:hypothetical protein [Bacillota bacterium]